MRTLIVLAASLALASCAATGGATGGGAADSPFPAARGTALPPPGLAPTGQAAPPEGRAPGGVDFGQWRGADPALYAPALQTQMRQRLAGKNAAEMRADLEANGFACEDQGRLECRIEIFERDCAHDWYVVQERGRPEPVAGYDVMCLGAR